MWRSILGYHQTHSPLKNHLTTLPNLTTLPDSHTIVAIHSPPFIRFDNEILPFCVAVLTLWQTMIFFIFVVARQT
jgi:hypothetical protein